MEGGAALVRSTIQPKLYDTTAFRKGLKPKQNSQTFVISNLQQEQVTVKVV